MVPSRGPFCAGRGHQFIIVGMFTLFYIIKGRKKSEKAATFMLRKILSAHLPQFVRVRVVW
jgi:hypothetical protein